MWPISSGGGGGGGGAPSGAAGGDLGGTYPDPSVTDDSHSHTAATLPASMPPTTAGSGSEIQIRASSTSLGVITDSAFSGTNLTLPVTLLGLLQANVDNLRLDGNTLSSTNANGNITLDPNGTGGVRIESSASLGNTESILFQTTPFDSSFDSQYKANLVKFGSSGVVRWSGSAGAQDAADTGIRREGVGIQLDTDGGSGLGCRLTGRVVEANTAGSGAPNLLAATESRKLLTNSGATAENYHTLPAAAPGIEFMASSPDSDGQRFVAQAGDEIEVAGAVSATGGFIRLAQFAKCLLVAIDTARWEARSMSGIITVDA